MRKDMQKVLLCLHDSADTCESCGARSNERGLTLQDIVDVLGWEKQRTASALGSAECFGMVRGNWERLPNKRWVRRYYVAGEGTRDYIEVLKKYYDSLGKVVE